jgi:predicted Zn finger-like uncharacterized protein
MKISCQSCQSKYTIADDKVAGKVVKIRCKKCGATIVVNGDGSNAANAMSFVPEQVAADNAWTLNVAEGDQRTMSVDEVIAAYRSGVVTDETFCWRDGMGDWLPLREIQELHSVCAANAVAAPPPPGMGAPAGNGAGDVAAAQAARRVPGRAGADLFSSAAAAGGEDEVMTSAPVGTPQARPAPAAPAVDDKMTGERNENSVLFSLSALTAKGPAAKPTAPGAEASGLIDIRQLSAQLHSTDDKKKNRLDDIMNLAGGGAFSPSLGGPILAAPAVQEYTAPEEAAAPAAAQQGKGRGVVIAAALAGVVVIVGAIGAAVTMMKSGKEGDQDKAAASASASASAAAVASASAAPSAPPAATETAAASASAAASSAPSTETASAPKAAAAGGGGGGGKVAAAAPQGGGGGGGGGAAAAPPPPKQDSLAAAMAGGAAPTPAAGGGGGGGAGTEPFNMGEAKARLAAAAAAVQSCKKGDATGTGKVVVMFAPSGAAQSASINGPPFEGTPTGNCVAARFRTVRVPAFSGSPFSVSKSFTIN